MQTIRLVSWEKIDNLAKRWVGSRVLSLPLNFVPHQSITPYIPYASHTKWPILTIPSLRPVSSSASIVTRLQRSKIQCIIMSKPSMCRISSLYVPIVRIRNSSRSPPISSIWPRRIPKLPRRMRRILMPVFRIPVRIPDAIMWPRPRPMHSCISRAHIANPGSPHTPRNRPVSAVIRHSDLQRHISITS